MFRLNWVFNTRLALEGESTTYRIAVIKGAIGKESTETGLRRTYVLNKLSPVEDQEIGEEIEPEKEQEEMVEPIETPTEETPMTEELPPREEPPIEELIIEEPIVEAPQEEVPPEMEVVEEIVETEELVEEPAVEETITEEPIVEESTPPVEETETGFKLVYDPETPVFVEKYQEVVGTIYGFEPSDSLYVTIEKSTSGENGWVLWTERNVRPSGERTPASNPHRQYLDLQFRP